MNMEKLRTATKQQLLNWFKVYAKRGDFESMLKISYELRRRGIGEEDDKQPQIKSTATQSELSSDDIESIISSVTY